MSDPMEDLDLLVSIREAMLAHLNDCAAVDYAAEAAVRAILDAGYRIVKPDDADIREFALYNNATDERAEPDLAYRAPRDVALRSIISIANKLMVNGEVEIEEVIRAPVDRAELLAELESMKEAGE